RRMLRSSRRKLRFVLLAARLQLRQQVRRHSLGADRQNHAPPAKAIPAERRATQGLRSPSHPAPQGANEHAYSRVRSGGGPGSACALRESCGMDRTGCVMSGTVVSVAYDAYRALVSRQS
ncbi:hypothetical protein N9L68_05395, partial [bacterium]|nr:hypothetical protein [bacterium]